MQHTGGHMFFEFQVARPVVSQTPAQQPLRDTGQRSSYLRLFQTQELWYVVRKQGLDTATQ
jgi:hypothetical protein